MSRFPPEITKSRNFEHDFVKIRFFTLSPFLEKQIWYPTPTLAAVHLSTRDNLIPLFEKMQFFNFLEKHVLVKIESKIRVIYRLLF